MAHLRALLMILIVVRLLMPPGICACQWSSPAARVLVALLHSDRQIPSQQEQDNDDHDAGCPASPLSSGMGVVPQSEPLLPPTLALGSPPLLQAPRAILAFTTKPDGFTPLDASLSPLYMTDRTLLL